MIEMLPLTHAVVPLLMHLINYGHFEIYLLNGPSNNLGLILNSCKFIQNLIETCALKQN